MSASHFDRTGLGLMVATIMVWAGSWIAMKLIVLYIGPFDFVALRYVSGSLVLFTLLLFLRKPLRMPPWRPTLLIGLTQTAGFQGFVQTALLTGGVGKVSLMAYTMPFWVILFSWSLLGERPGARHACGVALAAVGLICFIEPWHGVGDIKTILLGLGSGLCWGLGTVLTKREFNKHAPDIMAFTAWQMLFGGLAMVPVAWLTPQIAAQWGWPLVSGMVYVVLIGTAAGWLLWLSVVKRVPASIAGLSCLGVPIVAVLLAWVILQERPTLIEGLGMALILAGLRVASMAPRPNNFR